MVGLLWLLLLLSLSVSTSNSFSIHQSTTYRAVSFAATTRKPWTKLYAQSPDASFDDAVEDDDSSGQVSMPLPSLLQPQAVNDIDFVDLGLDNRLLTAIQAQRWLEPTPIQQLAIPQLLLPLQSSSSSGSGANTKHNRAVWCEAPTGGGKTACYVLPLLQNLLATTASSSSLSSTTSSRSGKVSALILCPTRELAVQIGNVVQSLASHIAPPSSSRKDTTKSSSSSQWRIVVVTGGMPREPQIQRLAACAQENGNDIDILIATPGRLVDVLQYYSAAAAPSMSRATADNVDDNDYSTNSDDDYDTTDSQRPNRIKTPRALSSSTRVASEAALEQRLLAALDNSNDDESRIGKHKKKQRGSSSSDRSLSLDQIQKLQLDRLDDQGRASLPSILQHVQYVILDEADRLLSKTFETEMDAVLDMLPGSSLSTTRTTTTQRPVHNVHTWLFSATFPKHVEPRVDWVLKRIQGRRHIDSNDNGANEVLRISCTNADRSLQANEETSTRLLKKLERTTSQRSIAQVGPASTITLRTIRLERRHRTQALRRLLDEHAADWDRVLVFVSTRYAAEHVSRKLRRHDINSAELHGKLNQDARTRRLDDLVRGKIRVLIATDVASRGLDIVGLPAVINYDLPRSPADFVHRIGRTGRAGRLGQALTFVTAESEAHLDLIEKRYLMADGLPDRETLSGLEPNEDIWRLEAQGAALRLTTTAATNAGGAGGSAAALSTPLLPSDKGLAHDRMFGGIKSSRRKSKKDKIREAHAAAAATAVATQQTGTASADS